MDSTKQSTTPIQQVRQAQHRLLKLLVEKILLEAMKGVPRSTGGSMNIRAGTPTDRRWQSFK